MELLKSKNMIFYSAFGLVFIILFIGCDDLNSVKNSTPQETCVVGTKLIGCGADGPARQGTSVSMSADGNTALIGGPEDDGFIGAAWVFKFTQGTWTPDGSKLVGTGSIGTASQGSSVVISGDGNTALVGGRDDNSFAGAAWVFIRSNGVWSQQGPKLVGSGANGVSSQGSSLSLSADGNTAVVGGNSDGGALGAVWVFTRTNGVWTQQGPKLVGTGTVSGSETAQGYSSSISADGNTIVIGGYKDNFNIGAVWIFTRSNGIWSQQGPKLIGTGAVGSAGQGASVSISANGNTIVSGAFEDNGRIGAAWIFTRSNGIWSQQGSKLVGTGSLGMSGQFAVSISADGNTTLLGGFSDNSDTGATWVFENLNGTWSQKGSKFVAPGAIGASQQGYSLSINADGTKAIVSGRIDDSNVGAAWVFTP